MAQSSQLPTLDIVTPQPRLIDLRVSIGAHAQEWPLYHLDSRTFAVRGCPVPENYVVHVTMRVSAVLRICVKARSLAPDVDAGVQFFAFVHTEPDVLALLVAAAPAPLVH